MLNDDRQLLNKIADGDVKALGILYVLYASRVRNFAFSLLKNSSEAEDLTQDLFLKIWNTRENLRSVDSLQSYLFSMTHNSVLNLIKHKNVKDRYRDHAADTHTEEYEPLSQIDTASCCRTSMRRWSGCRYCVRPSSRCTDMNIRHIRK